MKLVIATPLYPPEIGGPATYAQILEEGLPSYNIEVELIKFSDVRHLPKIIRHYAYYRRVLKAARYADAVLALDPVSVGLPAMLAAKRTRKPFILKVVGDYAWEQGQQRFGIALNLDDFVKEKNVSFPIRVFRIIQTRVARNASKVIVPSEYLKSIVVSWGIKADKIKVIYNAVSLPDHGELHDRLTNLPRPLVVTVGRLVPWKQVDGLIDIIERLHQEHTPAFLLVIGEGPERKRLEAYAAKKLGKYCLFAGTLSHADTLATMSSANALALNSSYEGLSHTIIEAQMLGVPTVATRVGGNAEIIEDGKNGLLVPFGDITAFANALGYAMHDSFIRSHLVLSAKHSVHRFSRETMLSATATTLQSI